MRFDLLYELAMPPFLERTEGQLVAQALDEIASADRLGFNGVWLTEHHFTPRYSHSSKPELVLAAAAARTRRLRLGLGVVPLPFHHPIHVAERVATLDLLSNGRLEVGLGRGFSPIEYAAFGIDMGESQARVMESLAILRASFRGMAVRHAGEHYRIDDVVVTPRVIQQPHPPLWTAAVSPTTFDWAAREGIGVLAGPFKPWLMVKSDIARYLGAWSHPEPPRIGMAIGMLCLRDGRRAKTIARPAFSWYYGELLRITGPVLEQQYPSYEHLRRLGRFRRLLALGPPRPGLLSAAGMAIAGGPAECVDRIAKLQRAGVTHVLCAIGAGAVASEIVLESLQCISTEVIPAFGERSPTVAAS